MIVSEIETGLRELGKASQDLILAYYSENMQSAHAHMDEIMAIIEQFENSEYHIEVFLRTEYPPLFERQKGDAIEHTPFVLHPNDNDCLDINHAEIEITIFVNEANEITGKDNIEVINAPTLILTSNDTHFIPTEYFDNIMLNVVLKKGERGH
ncbi:MAG: hypothetical protein HYT37_00425 [Candidatus Sungbacteria bacterium]|nr:hypothetical protein [Candidatus Sungbacteria bacterium]